MPTRGIVYIIWNSKGQLSSELQRSIKSAEQFNIPYTVVETADAPKHNFRNKTLMYDASPYDTTLFLDTDTEILGDLEYGFIQAERHGMALCIDHACCGLRWWKPHVLSHPDVVEYNTGVVFFNRLNPKIKDFFDYWKSIATTHPSDQATISKAFDHTGLNPFVLPAHVWNFRVYNGDRLFSPVKIWHAKEPHILTDSIREKLTTHHGWKWYKVPEIFAQNPQDEIHVI